jgi:membrane-associated protein
MMMSFMHFIANFDAHLPEIVATHALLGYSILFAMVFLQIGILPLFFLPGNPFLFVCGAVWAASQLNITILLLLLILATLLGNITAYWLGKTVGHAFFVDYLKWPSQQSLDKTHAFYEKHGEKGFLFSLFLPVIRTLAPFWAGVTLMHYLKFLRASTLGAVIWILVCVLAGYFFGNIPVIKMHLGLVTIMGLGAVVLMFLMKKGWDNLVK